MKNLIVILAVTVFGHVAAQASERPYHLFNPTPESEMRGFNTDRPSKTETPFTVDAGHFQLESDLLNFTEDRDRSSHSRSSTLNVFNNNYKFGLTDNSDLQIIVGSYVESRTTGRDAGEQKGFGDSVVRYKQNLYGNNGGASALTIMPYVKVPTAGAGLSNDRTEGGLVMPFRVNLPKEFGLGVQVQVDHLRRSDDKGWQTDYALSAMLDRKLIGNLNWFAELWSKSSDNALEGAKTTFDLGLTYKATERIQLDTGTFIGLTPAADDFNTFLGLSFLI